MTVRYLESQNRKVFGLNPTDAFVQTLTTNQNLTNQTIAMDRY